LQHRIDTSALRDKIIGVRIRAEGMSIVYDRVHKVVNCKVVSQRRQPEFFSGVKPLNQFPAKSKIYNSGFLYINIPNNFLYSSKEPPKIEMEL